MLAIVRLLPRRVAHRPARAQATRRCARHSVDGERGRGSLRERSRLLHEGGLDVTITVMGNTPSIVAAVVAGALDIGYTTIDSVASIHSHGIPLAVIAPATDYIDPITLNTAGVLVRPDSPIRTAKDFKGKTIASPALHSLGTTALLPGSTRTAEIRRPSVTSKFRFRLNRRRWPPGASMRSSRSSRSIARRRKPIASCLPDTARFRNASLPIFGLWHRTGPRRTRTSSRNSLRSIMRRTFGRTKITIRVP